MTPPVRIYFVFFFSALFRFFSPPGQRSGHWELQRHALQAHHSPHQGWQGGICDRGFHGAHQNRHALQKHEEIVFQVPGHCHRRLRQRAEQQSRSAREYQPGIIIRE